MSEEIKVDKTLWDSFAALFAGKPAPVQVPDPVIPEEYKVAMKERDDLKAAQAKLQAEAAHKSQLDNLTAELQKKDRFGVMFADAKFAGEAAEMFSGMPEKVREWTMRKMAALQAQVNFSKLTAEFGTTGAVAASNPVDEFSALVNAKKSEGKMKYADALSAVRVENPDLAAAYDEAMHSRAGKTKKGDE